MMKYIIEPMKITTLLLACLFALTGFAATPDFTPEPENDWVHYKTVDGVKISYKYADCEFPNNNWKQRWVLLKIENSTGADVAVEWDLEIYANGACTTCSSEEYHRTFVVDANSSIEGICDLTQNRDLTIFVQFNDKDNRVVNDRFELVNIQVAE